MMLAVVLLATALVGPLTMTRPAQVAPGVDAFPRIAHPATAAQRRINTAVTRLDARVRGSVAQCGREAGSIGGSWERRVAVTMRGPNFVSYLINDDVFCGGAHPDNGHMAITYDLATGAPVDWAALLTPRLTGTPTLETGADGARTVRIGSTRLHALYAVGYAAALTAADGPAECRGLSEFDGSESVQPLQAWLDGPAGALVLQFDLAHVVQACSMPVTVPADVLRQEGASPRLVNALLAARRGAGR